MECRLPEELNLHLELLCGIKILVLYCSSFLILQLGQFLANRLEAVYGIFNLLGEVEILVSYCCFLLLLELFDLKSRFLVKSGGTLIIDKLS